MTERQFRRLLAALYALALLLMAGGRLAGWLALSRCAAVSLPVEDAEQSSLIDYRTWYSFGEGSLLSTDDDPQLIWQPEAMVSGLMMTIRSSKPVSGPELYYTTAPDQSFTALRRLTPSTSDPASGVYTFRLPRPTRVFQLRLDPTNAAGAFFEIKVLCNPPVSAAAWFAPTAAEVLALAFSPLLAALAVREIGDMLFAVRRPSGKKRS